MKIKEKCKQEALQDTRPADQEEDSLGNRKEEHIPGLSVRCRLVVIKVRIYYLDRMKKIPLILLLLLAMGFL